MKRGKRAHLLLLATLLLTGCAGFWQNPNSTTSSGCTTDCTTDSSGNFYILVGGTTPQVQGESIVSGTLTKITSSPWSLSAIGGTPWAMAIAPNGDYLYVSTSSGVYVYPISSGELGSATEVSEDDAALALAVDTTGKWLIEAEQVSTGNIIMAAIPLDTSTGGANGSEIPADYTVASASVYGIAVSPDDDYVFVALGAGGTIVIPFTEGVGSGTSPFGATANVVPLATSGGSAESVAVDPSDDLFYVGETDAGPSGAGGLRVFTMASLSGATGLVQATGSPIDSGGSGPHAILPLSSGYVYVGNWNGTSTGNITSFSITSSASGYTVAATGSTATTGAEPMALAQDSSGDFLLDVNAEDNPGFAFYTYDATTAGLLDIQSSATTGTAPITILATP